MRGRVDHSRGEDTVSSERVLLQVGRISRVLVDHRSANCCLISHARVINALATAVKQALQKTFDESIEVSLMDSGDATRLALMSRPELGVTFTKLQCWLNESDPVTAVHWFICCLSCFRARYYSSALAGSLFH